MTSAQEPRPTARQIVRDDAAKHGWTLEQIYSSDVFKRDGVIMLVLWSLNNPESVAMASYLQDEGHPMKDMEGGPLCIVKARKWLAQERDADAIV